MTKTMTQGFRFLGGVVAVLSAIGCSSLDNCPDGRDPVSIMTGTTNKEALTYESAPWNNLDDFPAKTALWFKHDLGVTPLLTLPYLSFRSEGTANDESGSVALSAGNQTLIDCVDDRVIVLRNDTCERDFHVRLVAIDAAPENIEDTCCKNAPADLAACQSTSATSQR